MKRNSPDLPTLVQMWRTPLANDAKNVTYQRKGENVYKMLTAQVRDWPTPTATEYGSNCGGAAGRAGKVRPSLSRLVKDATSTTGNSLGHLNPEWVAQLMGFPDGWL